MDAKGHCKLRYGDGGDDEDADLEDFYDYSSRFYEVQLYVTNFVSFKRSTFLPVSLRSMERFLKEKGFNLGIQY